MLIPYNLKFVDISKLFSSNSNCIADIIIEFNNKEKSFTTIFKDTFEHLHICYI